MRPSVLQLVGRALRLRCLLCGGRPVFVSWFRLLPSCSVCGFRFERGERGYHLGAYFANLMLMETAFVVWFGGVAIATWPDVNWDVMQAGIWALMIVTPFFFWPWANTLFLAFDLLVRPPEEGDFESPAEPGMRARKE